MARDDGLTRRRQIRLSEDLDNLLVAEAHRLHITPSQVVRMALTSPFFLTSDVSNVNI